MTHSIWIDSHSRLKSYTASVKGAKSVVRIEVECSEPGSLGFLLEDLGKIQREQDLKAKRDNQALKSSNKKKTLLLEAPRLQLRDMRGDVE